MSKKRRDLTADEIQLWRRVATSVNRRKQEQQPPELAADDWPQKKIAPPAARAPVLRAATPAKPITAPPQDRSNEKRVRRGKLEVEASLDLHGYTQDAARAALGRFLSAAHRRGHRTVVVITGVGRAGEGVLRRRFPEWMSDPGVAAIISGFAPAHRSHGGAGAFYVFIKRRAETPD